MPRPSSRREDSAPDDLVRLYFDDIGRHPLLTKDDETRLAASLGLTTDATRRLQARALSKLRHPSSGHDLSDLLAS